MNARSAILACLLLLTSSTATLGQDDVEQLVDELGRLADVAQQAHVQPPVRQQMMLSAVRAVADAIDRPLSPDQTQAFSSVLPDRLTGLVTNVLKALELADDAEALRGVAVSGLLHSLPGQVQLVDASQLEVQQGSERFLSNTYVGIGIALSYDEELGLPTVTEVFASGPGFTAGLQAGDRIEVVDGQDTAGRSLQEMIKRLRGPEDSSLEMVVRQPEAEAREVHVVRRIVPRELVSGYRVLSDGIAYLKVEQVAASTVHELRKVEHQARQDTCRAMVLDWRGCGQSELHYSIALGDALLDGQPLGHRRTISDVERYVAAPESLFPGWPLVILLDRDTADHVAWLADSLRVNRRAHLMGFSPNRQYFDHTVVPVPHTDLSLIMATGRLYPPRPTFEEADGMMMALPPPSAENDDQLLQRAVELLGGDA